jgi:tetratricopeptide (TPR) repeat protein
LKRFIFSSQMSKMFQLPVALNGAKNLKAGFVALLLVASALHLPGQATSDDLAECQQIAQHAEERGDFGTAVREYERLANRLPRSPEVQSNLGVALYFHHDYGKAAAAFRRSIALKESLYAPHLFLGLTLAKLSHPAAAAAELKKAVAINGTDPVAHMSLGSEYTDISQFEAAIAQFKIAAQEKPEDPDIWYALGQSYLDLGNEETTRLVRLAPDGGRVWQLAGEQFEARGNSGKALELYIGAFKRRPDLEDLRTKIIALGGQPPAAKPEVSGTRALEDEIYARIKGDAALTRNAFERVALIAPDSSRAHQILANSYAAADRFEEAIKEYQMVLQRAPELPGTHAALCDALSRVGQISEAIKECEAEIALAPFNAEAYTGAARVLLLAHEDEQAENLLDKALTLESPPAFVYKLLGKLSLDQKKYRRAREMLSKYLSTETMDASAYYLLARACRFTGDQQCMDQAIAAFKRTSDAAKNTNEVQHVLDANRGQRKDPDDDERGTREAR